MLFTVLFQEKLLLLTIIYFISSSEHATSELYRTSDNAKQEMMYPNGTVIGYYSYVDNAGNPVHVKYFADDGSYGVELRSVKFILPEGVLPAATEQDKSDKPNKNAKKEKNKASDGDTSNFDTKIYDKSTFNTLFAHLYDGKGNVNGDNITTSRVYRKMTNRNAFSI